MTSFLQDHMQQEAESGRAKMLRLDTAVRFAIAVVSFHPTKPPYAAIRFNPRHSLSIPRPLPDEEFEEVHYGRGEELLYDRTDLLDYISRHNAATLQAMKEPASVYDWLVGLELGLSATAFHFASVNWKSKSIDFHGLRFEVVRPTAEEIAKWAEGGAK